MNRLKSGAVTLGLIGLLTIQGCNQFTIGGREPVDRRKSSFSAISDNYANEELKKTELKNSWELTDYFLSRGQYEEACNIIERTFKQDGFKEGMLCIDRADQYVDFLKIKSKELDFLKDRYNPK